MVDEFFRFCINRSCSTKCRGRSNYCPLADRIKAKNGGSIIGWSCRREWEEWRKEKEDE